MLELPSLDQSITAGSAWKEHSQGMISSWKNGLVFEQSLGNAEKIDLPITFVSAIRCTITLHLDTPQPVAASLLIASSLHFVLSHIFIPVSERHSVNMSSEHQQRVISYQREILDGFPCKIRTGILAGSRQNLPPGSRQDFGRRGFSSQWESRRDPSKILAGSEIPGSQNLARIVRRISPRFSPGSKNPGGQNLAGNLPRSSPRFSPGSNNPGS